MRTEPLPVDIPAEALSEFCPRRHIRKLALFGSALHGMLKPESDIDLLVEFEEGEVPGLLGIARLERELSALFGGRKVDLRTPRDLSRYFRDEVVRQAEVLYEAG